MASKKRRAVEEDEIIETKAKKIKLIPNSNLHDWKDYELVAEKESLDKRLAKTLIDLLDNENTIPFLCRYRKKLIQDTTPEKLRDVQSTLLSVRDLQTKIQNFVKSLEKKQTISEDLRDEIKAIRSFEELDFFKSLYKSEGKRTLYERAMELGLGQAATDLLEGKKSVNLESLVKSKVDGLKSKNEVQKGIKDIIVHQIAKNKLIADAVLELKSKYNIRLESKVTKEGKEDRNAYKFETYSDFSRPSNSLVPHQILALFRGENLKILKISFTLDDRFARDLEKVAKNTLLMKGKDYETRSKIFKEAFDEAFKKRISPLIIRRLRTELEKFAEKASVASFADNLKNLLLTMPVKGRKILGIDPGFDHGCKLALISESGDVLATDTIYPHKGKKSDESEKTVVDILSKYNCKLIALGNGKGCRETEVFLDRVIQKFKLTSVEYCVVSEQGASIYSCSDVAKKEFPKMDTNVISAVSIARRLLDPLSELVKIEPKHLGVGMYQHDVEEKTLDFSLNSVVSECVSYVGVDINCASVSLLKHIAGLTEKRALSIIEHRQKKGAFKSREELLDVKSIGPKTYTQMIGFLKIDKADNILDSTTIHPESYDVAKKILKDCKLKIDNFGSKTFVQQIGKYCELNSIEVLSSKFKEDAEKIENVLNTLKNESLQHDYREETNFKPDFKRGIQKLSDLKTNAVVKGVVRNIVDFGAFIDIGVQQDALLHKSKYKCQLKYGDRVECKILNVSENGKKIGLDFVKML